VLMINDEFLEQIMVVIECPECKGVPNTVTLFGYGHVQECPFCRGVGYCEIKPASREEMEKCGYKKEADIVFRTNI